MAVVTGDQVAAFIGEADDSELVTLASRYVVFAEACVRGYTRDRGFDPATGEPNDALAMVILSSAARLLTNPQLHRSERIGEWSARLTPFTGWTLPELAILDRYRVHSR